MIITTTHTVETKGIKEYKGIVFGESASSDPAHAMDLLREQARRIGANAVVGVSLHYAPVEAENSTMLMVVAYGTAVFVADSEAELMQ
ncbi:MAG: heavy metal-binding domain-containing protein [Turicibacter sp.]|nr:heavy metal-binding domain-containing protein [Turicibacter sp.]